MTDIKNYITKSGFDKLKKELDFLLRDERPKVVEIVNWAASNGDRSENGDYIYGKRRLREIDKRIYYLTKSLESAQIIDNSDKDGIDKIYFGATVEILRDNRVKQTITIVGKDEIDTSKGMISWASPLARRLIKCSLGDQIIFHNQENEELIEIISVKYNKNH